ncbi:MAG TPA: outer membrane beta-barrel protein [Vicinamibacterales bacterium]|nr:outer membrane beta-barrel protein [Vicinamibacterales bacterium]
MTKSLALIALTGLFALAGGAPAFAQAAGASSGADQPLFIDVNAGLAAKPAALTTSTTFTVFGESGAAATRMEPGTAGMFDVRVGYRVKPRFGVAVALSAGRSDVAASTTASVPSPIRFASPTTVSLDAGTSSRRETGLHLQAVYALPLSNSLLLSIAGGPSIVHLQQGVPNVTVAGGGTPSVVFATESANSLGANVGVDLSTLFSTHVGVGAFVRYVAAGVDLPSASDVKAGGVQAGGGVRVRF